MHACMHTYKYPIIVAQTVFCFGFWQLFQVDSWVLLTYVHLFLISHCLALHDTPVTSALSLVHTCNQSFLQGALHSFMEKVFRKQAECSVHCGHCVSLLVGNNYIYIYVHRSLYRHISVFILERMYLCMYVYVWKYTHTYVYGHTHIHTLIPPTLTSRSEFFLVFTVAPLCVAFNSGSEKLGSPYLCFGCLFTHSTHVKQMKHC